MSAEHSTVVIFTFFSPVLWMETFVAIFLLQVDDCLVFPLWPLFSCLVKLIPCPTRETFGNICVC